MVDLNDFIEGVKNYVPFQQEDRGQTEQVTPEQSQSTSETSVSNSADAMFTNTPSSSEIFHDDLLTGEKVLITGGGTGIGKKIALAFADHGADVAVASRNMDHLAPVAEKIERKGQNACATTVDIRNRDKVDQMRNTVIDELGGITCLINNAGANFIKQTQELTAEDWRTVVGTILDGTAHCTISIGQYMIENEIKGSIIANGATNSEKGAPYHAHSGAGKAGVHNLIQTVASEWGQYGIRANTVAPGIIETEGATEITGGSFPDRLLKTLSADRFGTSEDCVPIFLFLASDASAYITGGYFPVDGGHLLAPTTL